MNKNPKPVPKVKHPPRVDEATTAFFGQIPNALQFLVGMDPKAWVKTLPLREVDAIKFTRGTDGGISVLYESKGTQYQYHVDAEHFGVEPLVKYEGPSAPQPGELTTAEAGGMNTATQPDRSEDETKKVPTEPPTPVNPEPETSEETPDVPDQQDGDVRSESPAVEVPS